MIAINDPATGIESMRWTVDAQTTPGGTNVADWPLAEIPTDGMKPGVALISVIVNDSVVTHDVVILTDAHAPAAKVAVVIPTFTWYAYNDWGGPNLYEGAVSVSTLRPLAPGFAWRDDTDLRLCPPGRVVEPSVWRQHVAESEDSAWSACAGLPNWELRLLRWLCQQRIDVDVITSETLHADRSALDPHRLAIFVGHDEYWTAEMRDTVDHHRRSGGNQLFLTGNTAFWHARVDGSQLTSYKYRAHLDDPERATSMTGMWADPVNSRPESAMTGTSFTRGGYSRIGGATPLGAGGFTVWQPAHWLLRDTALRIGDVFGSNAGIVGYECDGCELQLKDGRPQPTGAGGTPPTFNVIATSPARLWSANEPGDFPAHLTLEPDEPGDLEFVAGRLVDSAGPSAFTCGHAVFGTFEDGGIVVSVGTTDWVYGLGADSVVDQITLTAIETLST